MNNSITTPQGLYLDLLKRSLTNWTHGHEEYAPVRFNRLGSAIRPFICSDRAVLMEKAPFDRKKRMFGQDWPAPIFAQTMIGLKRLDNIQMCMEKIIEDGIEGDFIETGVWKGGASIFMRGVLRVYGNTIPKVFVADSFQGLPPPNAENYPEDKEDIHHTYDELKISIDDVKNNFEAYGLLDDQVVFLKGWFKDTLPKAPISNLALLRLDGDMYESTMDALRALYGKLSIGGYVIVDDYCLPPCKKAIADFRAEFDIVEEIVDIDGAGAYWRRMR